MPPWLVLVLAIFTPLETFILAGVLWLLKVAAADRAALILEFRNVRDIVLYHDTWIKSHDRQRLEEMTRERK